MRRALDIAYYTGLGSVVLVFVFLLVLASLDNLTSTGTREDSVCVPWIAWILVAAFSASVLVLWIGGWIYVASNWSKRTPLLNSLCIFFLLLGPVFAGFTFHFLQRRKTPITEAGAHPMR